MDQAGNIGAICPKCSEERRVSWQEHFPHLTIKEGDYVKIRFKFTKYRDEQEWMWLEVMVVKGDYYIGELRNDSVYDPDYKYGLHISFLREDIADYCEQGDFDNYDSWMPTEDGKRFHEGHA